MNTHQWYQMGLRSIQPPNTFIGGVSATISTASALATNLGIDVSRITNFAIVGSDIKCLISGSYGSSVNFGGVSSLSYFNDVDGLVISLPASAFEGTKKGADYFYLPNCTNIGNRCFYNDDKNNLIGYIYIPRCTSIGTTVNNASDVVFGLNQRVKKIYVDSSMATINSGSVEADLAYTSSFGFTTISYVTNFTAPNPVTTLAAGTIYNTAIQLNFTAPSSTNAIDYYECYADGVLKNTIKASGQYITGLIASTSYNITLVAVDIFYNKSTVSNTLSVSTNTTSYLEYRTIAAYSLATNGVDAKNAYNGTVGAGVSFSSGAVFTNVTNSNIIVADNNDFSFTNGTNDLPFSISFKINFSALGDQWIVNKRNATGATDEWQVIYYLGKISLFLYSNSGSAYIFSEYTFTPTTGVDYTFAFTYAGDGASGLKVYRDGVLRTTTNTTFGSYTKMPNGTAPVTIGAQGWNLSAGRLTAKLKELYFFNSELTPTDVTYLQTNNYPF